ncbi:EthD family reductase [Pseudomonas sp. BN606]|uniref:EthD family reductase n=1 Tax=unclassified Pseudomonas TaxID=196821 RepID=UPI002455193C|nr:EthD family reductase [Pseudomonas sp. BN606]MDH4656803.1 EthD family reductase [Pseudomonas sp. BN606]
MATLTVSYPLTAESRFDRNYYVTTHLPLAQAAWGEFGLQSAEVLFPASGSQPLAALAILRFADQPAIDAALNSPKALEVLGDIAKFTDIKPVIFRADD